MQELSPRYPALTPSPKRQRVTLGDRVHAVLLAIVAIGTVSYWIAFFTTDVTKISTSAVYLGFESSFPLPDGWMTLCCLLAAFFLWRGDRRAVLWGLCAGSAMIFLGLIDFLFSYNQGNFRLPLGTEVWGEVLIIVFMLIFGPFTLRRMWCHRLNGA